MNCSASASRPTPNHAKMNCSASASSPTSNHANVHLAASLPSLSQTGGIQLTGRKNRYCVLAGDCIKYFVGLGDDGLPHDLKGAIELNKHTQVVVKEARLLIVRSGLPAFRKKSCTSPYPEPSTTRRFFETHQHNKNRTWDLEASSVDKAKAWRDRILSLLPPSAEGEPADS